MPSHSEMTSYLRKMQFGKWTKRDWRELRPRLKKEVKLELSVNQKNMSEDTPVETPADKVPEDAPERAE